MKELKYWAEIALNAQNSVFLDKIIEDFNLFMKFLNENYPNKHTDWYNQHPISVLFADRIFNLAGPHITKSYIQCKSLTKGETIDY